jgi:MFS family permease
MGMDAMALVIAGSTVGEVSGPWLGTLMYEWTQNIGPTYWLLAIMSGILTVITFVIALHEERNAKKDKVTVGATIATTTNSDKNKKTIEAGHIGITINGSHPNGVPRISMMASESDISIVDDGMSSIRSSDHSRTVSNASTISGGRFSSSPSVAESDSTSDPMSTIDDNDLCVDDSDMDVPNVGGVAHQLSVIPDEPTTPVAATAGTDKIDDTTPSKKEVIEEEDDEVVTTVVLGTSRWSPLLFLLRDGTFMRLAFVLCMTSLPRGALDLLLPLYLDAVHGASSLTIGIVFGCGSVFFVIGSLIAGRFTPVCDRPMAYISGAIILMASFAAMVLYMPNLYTITSAFCAFAVLCVFINVVTCNQLEELATDLRQYDASIGDRVMALACLFWSAGLAISYLISGIPEESHQQQMLVAVMAAAAVLYALIVIVPTYGTPCSSHKDDDTVTIEATATSASTTVVAPSTNTIPTTGSLELVVVRDKEIAPVVEVVSSTMPTLTLPPSVVPLPLPSITTSLPSSSSFVNTSSNGGSGSVPSSPRGLTVVTSTPYLTGMTGNVLIIPTPRQQQQRATPKSVATTNVINTTKYCGHPLAHGSPVASPRPRPIVPGAIILGPTITIPSIPTTTTISSSTIVNTNGSTPSSPRVNGHIKHFSLDVNQLHAVLAAHQRNQTAHLHAAHSMETNNLPFPRYLPSVESNVPAAMITFHY